MKSRNVNIMLNDSISPAFIPGEEEVCGHALEDLTGEQISFKGKFLLEGYQDKPAIEGLSVKWQEALFIVRKERGRNSI
jgi:hypothetical protein